MARSDYTIDQVVDQGEAIYEARIRPFVEAGNKGRYVVVNVETGEYALGDSTLELSHQLHRDHPGAALYAVLIGEPVIGYIGCGH